MINPNLTGESHSFGIFESGENLGLRTITLAEENLIRAQTVQSCLLLSKNVQTHRIILQNASLKFNAGNLEVDRNNKNNYHHLTGQECYTVVFHEDKMLFVQDVEFTKSRIHP